MTPEELEIAKEMEIQRANTSPAFKENQILGSLKDTTLGTGISTTELGKIRGF